MTAGHVSEQVRERVRAQAGDRCGYCRSPQHLVLAPLEIDHLQPTSRGGSDHESNLWLACRMCNGFKSDQTEGRDPLANRMVLLFNPRTQKWSNHFRWGADQLHILGQTPTGRATVIALQLNNALAVTVRSFWLLAHWHPPQE